MGLYIISVLFWPIVIISLIIFAIGRIRRKKTGTGIDKDWYMQFSLSKEDAVSQLFILLSILFLGVTLVAFNRDVGNPMTWQTILFITSIVAFITSYSLKVVYALVYGILSFIIWWGAQAAEWVYDSHIKAVAILSGIAILFIVLFTLGRAHEKENRYKRFALVYSVLGLFAVTGILFYLSTKPGIASLAEMTKGNAITNSWQMTLSLLAFVLSLIATAGYGIVKKLLSSYELAGVALIALLFGAFVIAPQQQLFINTGYYSYNGTLTDAGVLWAIILNILVFVELVALMFLGYARRESWLINFGVIGLFILIIIKYFDWFFTFLDKSIFFIGAGILLFVVGWFMERGRRYMISTMVNETATQTQ